MGFRLPDINFQEGLQAVGESLQKLAGTAVENVNAIGSQVAEAAGKAGTAVGAAVGQAVNTAAEGVEDAKRTVEEKKTMNFQSVESLQPVVNVLNDAAAALSDSNRTIRESAIPEVLGGALGAAAGGTVSFAALYGLGTVGVSAAGMTSALATAGSLVGGGMAAGVLVLAAPVALAACAGVGIASNLKAKQLQQGKGATLQGGLEEAPGHHPGFES